MQDGSVATLFLYLPRFASKKEESPSFVIWPVVFTENQAFLVGSELDEDVDMVDADMVDADMVDGV